MKIKLMLIGLCIAVVAMATALGGCTGSTPTTTPAIVSPTAAVSVAAPTVTATATPPIVTTPAVTALPMPSMTAPAVNSTDNSKMEALSWIYMVTDDLDQINASINSAPNPINRDAFYWWLMQEEPKMRNYKSDVELMETNVNAYLLSIPPEGPDHIAIKGMLDNASANADDMIYNYNKLVDTFNSGDEGKYSQANNV